MFLGNPDRKGGAGAFIGYDISDRYAQISFWLPGADKPETLSQVMGEEEYMIPAVDVYKRQPISKLFPVLLSLIFFPNPFSLSLALLPPYIVQIPRSSPFLVLCPSPAAVRV